jgi:hypothetical protein
MNDLARRLNEAGQTPWTSTTRLSDLLLVLRQISQATKASKRPKSEGIAFSNRLARQYASKLRTAPAGVAREALGALIMSGLVKQVSPARVNSFARHSARYCLTPDGIRLMRSTAECSLAVGAARKLAAAPERLEKGLNRRWPFRPQLLIDLAKVTQADTQAARESVQSLLKCKDTRSCTKVVLNAVATREHTAKVQPSGQITTSFNSCPKVLKPHLRIDGEPVAICDISSAHWMFLPRLVTNRLDYCRERGDDENELAPLRAELSRLIQLCSSGSFYKSTLMDSATASDVKGRKKLLNILLNSPRSKAANNCVWKSLRRQFPLCVGIIDSIKGDHRAKGDKHRAISRQLQHFTACAINAALQDMQAQGLPAIPDTDALIVRQRDRDAACIAIGRAMFRETRGVCVTVDGIIFAT